MKRRPRLQVKPNVAAKSGTIKSASELESGCNMPLPKASSQPNNLTDNINHEITDSVNDSSKSEVTEDKMLAEPEVDNIERDHLLSCDILTSGAENSVTDSSRLHRITEPEKPMVLEDETFQVEPRNDQLTSRAVEPIEVNDQALVSTQGCKTSSESDSIPTTATRRRYTKIRPVFPQIAKNKQSSAAANSVHSSGNSEPINKQEQAEVAQDTCLTDQTKDVTSECQVPADGPTNDNGLNVSAKQDESCAIPMSADAVLNESSADADITSNVADEQHIPPSNECIVSSSQNSVSSSKVSKKSQRRFIKAQPNLSQFTKCKQNSAVSTKPHASVSEVQPAVPQSSTETNAASEDDGSHENGMNTDAAVVAAADVGKCTVPPSKLLESNQNSDATDGCRSPRFVPMSPPRIPRQFAKMRPNLPSSVKQKKSSPAENISDPVASAMEDEPFIPAAVAQKKAPVRVECSLEEGVSSEESVLILPEAAEKAAAKIIARKLKQKKKKRAMESLDAPIDSSKVCMRDLIYMNPVNNPMKSKTVETKGNGSLKASSIIKNPASSLSETPKQNFTTPQLKLSADGTIVVNHDSLIIEREPVDTLENTEAIDETETVGVGYPKKIRTRSWSKKETRKFFAALSMIGTDFFLMTNLFPGRERAELKRKFKREEKLHQAMVETALNDRRCLDMSVMAVHSSDEDVKPKPVKHRQGGKRGPRGGKKEVAGFEVDHCKSVGGKENEPHSDLKIKPERKRKREKETQAGKKSKKKKVPTATLR